MTTVRRYLHSKFMKGPLVIPNLNVVLGRAKEDTGLRDGRHPTDRDVPLATNAGQVDQPRTSSCDQRHAPPANTAKSYPSQLTLSETSFETFKLALQSLVNVNLLWIGSAAKGLLELINRLEGIKIAKAEWKNLRHRYEEIASLVEGYGELKRADEILGRPLARVMDEFRNELIKFTESHGSQRLGEKLLKFGKEFIMLDQVRMIINNHNKMLFELIHEITLVIATDTKRDVKEILARLRFHALVEEESAEQKRVVFDVVTANHSKRLFHDLRLIGSGLASLEASHITADHSVDAFSNIVMKNDRNDSLTVWMIVACVMWLIGSYWTI